MCTCSTPKKTEATVTLPPSVLDQLRQWRLRASLRFVAKSIRSQPPGQAGK